MTFTWELVGTPPKATRDPEYPKLLEAVRTRVSLSTTSTATAFTSSDIVPKDAYGLYDFRVAVSDDDPPSEVSGRFGRGQARTQIKLLGPEQDLEILKPKEGGAAILRRTTGDSVEVAWSITPSLASALDAFSPGWRIRVTIAPPAVLASLRSPTVFQFEAIGAPLKDRVSWDGTQQDGTFAAAGAYDVMVDVRDTNGDPIALSSRTTSVHEHCAVLIDNFSAWADLINFRPPFPVEQSLLRRPGSGWAVQTIEKAHGPLNLDYYPVRVNALPAGLPTAAAVLSAVRRDMIMRTLLDPSVATLDPFSLSDELLWASDRPLGAVLSFTMSPAFDLLGLDHGSVVCAESALSRYRLSTVSAPAPTDWMHPVSGTASGGFITSQMRIWCFTREAGPCDAIARPHCRLEDMEQR